MLLLSCNGMKEVNISLLRTANSKYMQSQKFTFCPKFLEGTVFGYEILKIQSYVTQIKFCPKFLERSVVVYEIFS